MSESGWYNIPRSSLWLKMKDDWNITCLFWQQSCRLICNSPADYAPRKNMSLLLLAAERRKPVKSEKVKVREINNLGKFQDAATFWAWCLRISELGNFMNHSCCQRHSKAVHSDYWGTRFQRPPRLTVQHRGSCCNILIRSATQLYTACDLCKHHAVNLKDIDGRKVLKSAFCLANKQGKHWWLHFHSFTKAPRFCTMEVQDIDIL